MRLREAQESARRQTKCIDRELLEIDKKTS